MATTRYRKVNKDVDELMMLCDVDMSGTTIEIYNYIRVVDDLKTAKKGRSNQQAARMNEQATPCSLAPIQKFLEAQVHHAWKGRIVFKDREDAPTCAACGSSLQADFDDLSVWQTAGV